MSEKQRAIQELASQYRTLRNIEDEITALEDDLRKTHKTSEAELEKIANDPYAY